MLEVDFQKSALSLWFVDFLDHYPLFSANQKRDLLIQRVLSHNGRTIFFKFIAEGDLSDFVF